MAFNLLARFNLDSRPMKSGLKQVERQVSSTSRMIKGRLAAAFSVGAASALFRRTISEMQDLSATSLRLGQSAEFLQAWSAAAAEMANINPGASITGLQRFTRRLAQAAEGSGELAPILERLNIATRNQDGSMRPVNDVLRDYADAIRDAESDSQRLLLAFKAFDTEGAGLVNILKNGATGLDELLQRARETGQVLDNETVESLAMVGNELGILANRVITTWAPVFNFFVERFREINDLIAITVFGLGKFYKEALSGGGGLMERLQRGGEAFRENAENIIDGRIARQRAIRNAGQFGQNGLPIDTRPEDIAAARARGATAGRSARVLDNGADSLRQVGGIRGNFAASSLAREHARTRREIVQATNSLHASVRELLGRALSNL